MLHLSNSRPTHFHSSAQWKRAEEVDASPLCFQLLQTSPGKQVTERSAYRKNVNTRRRPLVTAIIHLPIRLSLLKGAKMKFSRTSLRSSEYTQNLVQICRNPTTDELCVYISNLSSAWLLHWPQSSPTESKTKQIKEALILTPSQIQDKGLVSPHMDNIHECITSSLWHRSNHATLWFSD